VKDIQPRAALDVRGDIAGEPLDLGAELLGLLDEVGDAGGDLGRTRPAQGR